MSAFHLFSSPDPFSSSSSDPRFRPSSLWATSLLALVILGFGAINAGAIAWTATPDGGQWVPGPDSGPCPTGKVCAEWVDDGPDADNDGVLCCIDRAEIYSNSFSACETIVGSAFGPKEGSDG